MAARQSTQTISSRERSLPHVDYEDKLSKWLLFSFLFHGALILSLFLVPFLPSGSRPSYPVYTVDLVGGEKIGRNNLGTELVPPSAPKAAPKKTAEEVPPPPVQETKQETKKEKPKPVEKEAPPEEKVALKEATKKEPKKEPTKDTKSESKTEESALDRVRERLIQSAVDRAKNRTEVEQKPSKGDVISSGLGEGEGAAALGPGGRGGGVVKGMEFIIYQNRMLSSIKDNWAWVGQKSNLKVVVHFSIKDNGEITGLKIVHPSGDPSYDESVLRAVKKSSPLPPPPESSRKDFADVELTFRPKDLGA
ncbi:MAG TPA: TonB family protein [Candidatus Binatia bacterium]|nr:TonB family protein [Candidatus Binatia bacterium]